jgi:glycosyltransferase involved in cell wall biosynthesis
MKISVIIPTYNRKDVLISKTIPALEKQVFSKTDYELIIINDGSIDGTLEAIEEHIANSKCNIQLITQSNLGPATARNRAIRQASGDILIIIGDDTYPPSNNFINIHYEHHCNIYQDNEVLLGLTVWDKSIETPFMRLLQDTDMQFAYNSIDNNTYVNYKYFYTSNISLKKSFITSNNEFLDENFKLAAYEDIEWGFRLEKKLNMKLFYDNKALLYHHHKYTPSDFLKRLSACELVLNNIKENNQDFYMEIKHNIPFYTVIKICLKSILSFRFFSKLIPFDTNFEAYPKQIQKLIFKLWTIKFR